jgi:hypothetical protein
MASDKFSLSTKFTFTHTYEGIYIHVLFSVKSKYKAFSSSVTTSLRRRQNWGVAPCSLNFNNRTKRIVSFVTRQFCIYKFVWKDVILMKESVLFDFVIDGYNL